MTVPSGNGESRGPDSATNMGTPLPGSRPQRAAANNAKFANFLEYPADPKDQAGFGKEDMQGDSPHMSTANIRVADVIAPPPDLRSWGNGGESFGGN